jgi:hypothetical protein
MMGMGDDGGFRFHLLVRSDGTVYCPRAQADVPQVVCHVCRHNGGVSSRGNETVLECALVRTRDDVYRALYPPLAEPPPVEQPPV